MKKGYEAEVLRSKWRWRTEMRHQKESKVAKGQRSGIYTTLHLLLKESRGDVEHKKCKAFNMQDLFWYGNNTKSSLRSKVEI